MIFCVKPRPPARLPNARATPGAQRRREGLRAKSCGLFSNEYSLLEGILNPIVELAPRPIRVSTFHRNGLPLIPLVDQETLRAH
jgi:hypothetical protein